MLPLKLGLSRNNLKGRSLRFRPFLVSLKNLLNMARIKYSGLVTEINGSSGGTTFQRNLYGSTIKNKPLMRRPNTSYQNNQKTIMSVVANSWRLLSDVERGSYINYASVNPTPTRLNPNAYLNGYNLFLKYNALRLLAGLSVLNESGNEVQAVTLDDYRLVRDGIEDLLIAESGSIDSDMISLAFVSPVIPAYTLARYTKTRFINAGTEIVTNVLNRLDIDYQARYGVPLVLNSFYYVDITLLSTVSARVVEIPTKVMELQNA